jgi:hypothetical protein
MNDRADTAAVTLAGVPEIRDLLLRAISKERVEELSYRDDFPPPTAVLAQGGVWLADEVEAWFDEHREVLANLFRTGLEPPAATRS